MKALFHSTLNTHTPPRIIRLALSCAAVIAAGCSPAGDEARAHHWSKASSFDIVVSEGVLHFLYGIEPEGSRSPEFFHVHSVDGGNSWSAPAAIPTAHGIPGNHKRGNDPQLAARGNRIAALWTADGDGPWGSGPLAIAVSHDGAETWTPFPGPPAMPGEEDAGFRFPAVTLDDDFLHAVWIHALDDERSLRYARFSFSSETWSATLTIDPEICACCWNRLEIAPDGTLFALYRDHNPSDMALAVSRDQGQTWEKRGHAGSFAWQFEGCPHVGGGLVLLPGKNSPRLASTVWSGHENHSGAYILDSDDLGSSWSIAHALPAGRNTDLAAFGSGSLIAVWDQVENGTQSVFYATHTPGEDSWSAPVQVSPKDRRATHPRVVTEADTALILWSSENTSGSAATKTALISGQNRK